MWRSSYDEDYDRQRAYLIKILFPNDHILSPVPEQDESVSSTSGLSTAARRPVVRPESPYSPLPSLVIEKEPNKHDDPIEFYQDLEKKIMKIYRRLFIEDRSDISDISDSDMDITDPIRGDYFNRADIRGEAGGSDCIFITEDCEENENKANDQSPLLIQAAEDKKPNIKDSKELDDVHDETFKLDSGEYLSKATYVIEEIPSFRKTSSLKIIADDQNTSEVISKDSDEDIPILQKQCRLINNTLIDGQTQEDISKPISASIASKCDKSNEKLDIIFSIPEIPSNDSNDDKTDGENSDVSYIIPFRQISFKDVNKDVTLIEKSPSPEFNILPRKNFVPHLAEQESNDRVKKHTNSESRTTSSSSLDSMVTCKQKTFIADVHRDGTPVRKSSPVYESNILQEDVLSPLALLLSNNGQVHKHTGNHESVSRSSSNELDMSYRQITFTADVHRDGTTIRKSPSPVYETIIEGDNILQEDVNNESVNTCSSNGLDMSYRQVTFIADMHRDGTPIRKSLSPVYETNIEENISHNDVPSPLAVQKSHDDQAQKHKDNNESVNTCPSIELDMPNRQITYKADMHMDGTPVKRKLSTVYETNIEREDISQQDDASHIAELEDNYDPKTKSQNSSIRCDDIELMRTPRIITSTGSVPNERYRESDEQDIAVKNRIRSLELDTESESSIDDAITSCLEEIDLHVLRTSPPAEIIDSPKDSAISGRMNEERGPSKHKSTTSSPIPNKRPKYDDASTQTNFEREPLYEEIFRGIIKIDDNIRCRVYKEI